MNKTKVALTVEEHLNGVDYSDNGSYIPTKFSAGFLAFIQMANDGNLENKSPVIHYKVIDKFDAPHNVNAGRIINLMHRGLAKTTLVRYLILYIAAFGELPHFGHVGLAIYVSDSIENGVKNMRKNLEYQWENSKFLREWIPEAKFTDIRWEFKNKAGKSFVVKGYGAKALSLDSELFTPTGRTTIGACKVGDRIYGADGKLTTIIRKSEVFHKPMYRLELEDGRFIKVSEDHLNPVVLKENCHNKARFTDYVLPTTELLKLPLTFERKRKRSGKSDYVSSERTMFVRNIEPIQYADAVLPIDPYTLGAILGDGRIRKDCGSVELTCHEAELEHYHKEIPYEFGAIYKDPRSRAVTQSIRGLGRRLKDMKLNVRGELKFIPHEYFQGSVAQRLAIVQGLMDTDGTCSELGRTSFTSQSYQLCDDLACMVRSLGGTAFMRKESCADAWRVEIWSELPLFRIARKATRFKPRSRLVAVKSITAIELEPSQCIAIDNEERQFITECYFRTHNTGVRGVSELNQRPKLALLDDLLSDSDARSATVIADIEDTVYNAVKFALHPEHNKIIWNGTPFNAADPLYKAVESGAWEVNVYPVCERFPCTREEFKGSWEDRFSYDYVKKEYEDAVQVGRMHSFDQELMLRIMSDEDRMITEDDLRWYESKDLPHLLPFLNIYVTTDWATSEKQSADFSGTNVWGINNNGDWYWLAGLCVRQTMDKNIETLFNYVANYRPLSVGIEVSGQQGGFIPWIKQEMVRRNTFFTLASSNNGGREGIKPSTDKLQRFNVVVPWFKQGKMYFPQDKQATDPALREMLSEIRLVSPAGFKSKHDDQLDNVSQLALLNAYKPGYAMPNTVLPDSPFAVSMSTEHSTNSYFV